MIDLKLEDAVTKAMLRARKKAGRVVGKKIVAERRRALGKIGSRRKKGVRSIVGQDGTLVVLDHAPLAMAQEFGKTITSRGRDLMLGRPADRYLTGGAYFTDKKRKLLFYKKDGEEKPRLIASFRKSIRISKLAANRRLTRIAQKHIDEYENQISENFIL